MHDHYSPPTITPADISLPPTITLDLTWLVADTQQFGSSRIKTSSTNGSD
ncbi:hypothetical protein [Microbacterium murale]|uniref:Uncharacterized protein n=1 Tax=Microbacterium murale TaxID=1081040 RepID=A0ABQ1S472_9MICO|nr:hypothetical protein [Microbacterium murale]GGD90077.1 hypothetical protein GCM10007269_35850 [Microbacterium murale]